MTGSGPTAWERQRASLRQEIADEALRLFTEQGFDATTIDQVSANVGISRRTFFRYFGTKEDVLLGDLVARGEEIAEALAARPSDEDGWTALLEAMRDGRARRPTDLASDLAIGRMMLRTPSLRARHAEKQRRWHELLVPLVAARTDDPTGVTAAAIVATALACLDVASEAFAAADGDADLETLFLVALGAARGTPAVAPR